MTYIRSYIVHCIENTCVGDLRKWLDYTELSAYYKLHNLENKYIKKIILNDCRSLFYLAALANMCHGFSIIYKNRFSHGLATVLRGM